MTCQKKSLESYLRWLFDSRIYILASAGLPMISLWVECGVHCAQIYKALQNKKA